MQNPRALRGVVECRLVCNGVPRPRRAGTRFRVVSKRKRGIACCQSCRCRRRFNFARKSPLHGISVRSQQQMVGDPPPLILVPSETPGLLGNALSGLRRSARVPRARRFLDEAPPRPQCEQSNVLGAQQVSHTRQSGARNK